MVRFQPRPQPSIAQSSESDVSPTNAAEERADDACATHVLRADLIPLPRAEH